jgi:hypothetical protein
LLARGILDRQIAHLQCSETDRAQPASGREQNYSVVDTAAPGTATTVRSRRNVADLSAVDRHRPEPSSGEKADC